MMSRRARIVALWSIGMVASLWMVVHARYITDLSAFLPAKPTPMQKLLVDQLRDGPASRLLVIALEHGDPKTRATISETMAQRLREDPTFSSVDNGASLTAERDRSFIFDHRYLLSDAVTPGHFSPDGLHAAIADTIDNLSSATGLLLKSLVPHDPTGETLHILDQIGHSQGPATDNGVWTSTDGTRTLLVAQTAAAGSDTDGQEHAIETIRAAFAASTAQARLAPTLGMSDVSLRMSGPGVFAVAARAKIKHAATRLSIISSILVVGLLFTVYRSIPALILGLLPVVSGALAGIAAVAAGFGVVHGITLGFGITLIGESVDYSIYFFIQSLRVNGSGDGSGSWQRRLWPTIRLGMFTSVCGFASLLPSGFPGLAQLGLYSISGLVVAALVTRFVLPELLPHGFEIRDVTPIGMRIGALRDAARAHRRTIALGMWAVAVLAVLILYRHHETLWNRELSSLSPITADEQRYDALLRSDLGAADVLDLIIVSGADLQTVLQGAERVADTLRPLLDANVVGAVDSPADYLPSLQTQQSRRDALPVRPVLADHLRIATRDLNLQENELEPFVDDVDAARKGGLVTVDDLRATSLATGFASLILHQADRWSALLPLHAPRGVSAAPSIDTVRVGAALSAAHLPDTHILDIKAQADALYADYLHEAMRLSAAGFTLIVVLLVVTLRSASRAMRVLAPLVLAVLVVAASLAMFAVQLTILHLVGMLLIVAVGSNYALFFDEEASHAANANSPLTLASLGIANLSTVIGFGLLSFSQVPVLEALGTTVAPGACLALVFSALITSRTRAHA